MMRSVAALVAVVGLTATPAVAQAAAPDALRNAPPEVDRSRPGGDPTDPSRSRSGGGPTGDDIIEDSESGGPGRSVIRPPMSTDPGIQRGAPETGTTPVIPPPGTPGGDRSVQPR